MIMLLTLLLMFDSPMQILLVVVVLALLFGSSKLPQLAKSLGQSRKAFKEGLREGEEEDAEPALISTTTGKPQLNHMSDDELEAEMRRRSEARAEH